MRAASLFAALLLALPAMAQENARGRMLYELHCGDCHYERVHERTRSSVKNLAELRDMVARWAPMTRHRFTFDEKEEVVQYLNASHYRFAAVETHQHSFADSEKWSHVFDDPERDAWQKPHEVIAALGLPDDAMVADIGAGTGYFAARLANMVKRGRVYAVDVEPAMVKHLAERAKREHLGNLVAVLGAGGDARLPTKVDLALLVDVYHHIESRPQYFRRLKASLNPGGRIAVIDFRLDSTEGPPRDARIAPEQVKAEMAQAGFRLVTEHGFLPRQYFLVFR